MLTVPFPTIGGLVIKILTSFVQLIDMRCDSSEQCMLRNQPTTSANVTQAFVGELDRVRQFSEI